MKKIDYEFKSKVMSSALYEQYKEYRKINYYDYCYKMYGEINNNLELPDIKKARSIFVNGLTLPKEWKECERIFSSNAKKTQRLRARISSYINDGPCIFLTLTFTDKVLDSTSEDTRRTYVTRFLKEHTIKYVANIDYGKINQREHYHAVVRTDVDFDYRWWPYGAINFQRISHEDIDIKRISKYITKLTNHAVKSSNKRCVLIYSR